MVEGARGIEMSTNWVGMKRNKNNIKQCFGDNLQSSIWSTFADWFPLNKHVVFNDNLGLAERLTVAVVYVLQCSIADFTRVLYMVAKTGTFRITQICLDPTTVRWKPWTDCAIHKCLYGGCRSGKLLWQEEFTIRVTDEDEVGMNLLEYPTRSTTWNGTIQAEFIFLDLKDGRSIHQWTWSNEQIQMARSPKHGYNSCKKNNWKDAGGGLYLDRHQKAGRVWQRRR